MEWETIEAKWHDMARRLRQGQPPPLTAPDAVSRPEPRQAADPEPRAVDETAIRATV